MQVTVLGAGRVGLSTALSFAYVGHEVTCIDKREDALAPLRRRQPTFYEPGIAHLLQQTDVRFCDRLTPESASAPVVMVAVGTPPLADGRADLSSVESVASQIASLLPSGRKTIFLIKSTVPPGTSQRIQNLIDDSMAADGAAVTVAANPEFLRGGSSLMDTLCPDRIVLGTSDARSKAALLELYQPIIDQQFPLPSQVTRPNRTRPIPVVATTPLNAELIKYVSNAFLAARLSFVNEIAGLAERLGGDITEVMRGVGLDPRIGSSYLVAGVGWGGPCFGKDASALLRLAEDRNYEMPILQSTITVNERQRRAVVEKLERALGTLQGMTVGLLGLAYKADTDEVIDSPSLAVASWLAAAGAKVRGFDPMAEQAAKRWYPHIDIEYSNSALEAADGCDAVVVMCEWQQFRELPLRELARRMRGKILLDAKNYLERQSVEESGLTYYGMGR
jgi:UDPglucose 6-dehydrogenase